MQELLSFVNSLSFEIHTPTLDNNIHRIDRGGKKKNAWYVGAILETFKGDEFLICYFGDWRTGEKHIYKPDRKFSQQDQKAISQKLREMEAKRKKETEIKNKEAEKEASDIWDKAQETPKEIHPYIAKKQIQSEHLNVRYHKDYIAVPVRDIKSNLVGIQKIYSNSSKWFLTGQKKSECFHYIGLFDEDETPKIFLCEGFATAASIYLATNVPVFIAFDAGNLTKVANILTTEYPTLDIIVCGDDDRFTKGNPGRKAADAAALICMSKAIYPAFTDPAIKQSDYNDLHVNESLQKVRDQIGNAKIPKTGFIPLGFDQGTHFFYVYDSKSITKMSAFTNTDLYSLSPKAYWEARWMGTRGILWEDIKDDLIQQSKRAGIFDSSRVRGSGVWRDYGRTVINTGEYLLVNGERVEIKQHKSTYVYVQTKNSIRNISKKPLPVGKSVRLFDTCKKLNWREPSQAYFLTGWLALARIAGALPVRPHIWVTGESGSGKSTVMNELVSPCLGNTNGWLFLQGSSSEAGIRQSISADSIPIIFDEFETNDRKSAERIDSILELLRQTWSATGGKIVKGSATGYSVGYSLSFAALVSSIRIGLGNDADRSRFSVLELDKSVMDDWDEIEFGLSLIDTEFGDSLFARSCDQIENILASYRVLQSAIAKGKSQRLGQQYGMLLAGYHSTVSDKAITQSQAVELIGKIDFKSDDDDQISDQDELLNTILTTKVRMEILTADSRQSKYAEVMIKKAIEIGGNYHEELEKYGMAVKGNYLCILSSHAGLAKILSSTKWARNWSRTLKRLDGAKTNKKIWLSKLQKSVRSTQIPLDLT